MAESLVEIDDPLVAALDPGELREVAEVTASITSSIAPAEAVVTPPDWLRAEQVAPLQRVIAALERYGTALLADPTGSGKSYIALAVARVLQDRRPVAILAPAVMRAQWQETAARVGVPIAWQSHESVSRGCLPPNATRLVIIDESHRFRNPGTARYRHLSRWLAGRRLLLLTATPVVNRLDDLGHQLLLGLRSDALALDGVPDLLASLQRSQPHPAFGRVVLCRPTPDEQPRARREILSWRPPLEFGTLLSDIDQLHLSTDPGVAALIRMTLWRALSSSLAALTGALRRYLLLLEHSQAASNRGRHVTREEIRRFSSSSLDQLVMWELVPVSEAPADLVPGDIAAVNRAIALASELVDPRLAQLAEALKDGRPTIIFTSSRDTLRALKEGIGPDAAWICGNDAGIGRTRVPAATVLSWFRPLPLFRPGAGRIPHVLLATDVAAEGLDLQRAERIVHFDLPWTPMRLDQREGRAVRLGNLRSEVEVARWALWPALEARLRQTGRLLQKQRTISTMGIDEASHWLYRWRSEFIRGTLCSPGFAAIEGETAGWLVAIAFDRSAALGNPSSVPAELLWIPDDGEPLLDPSITTRLLAVAARAPASHAGETSEIRHRLAEWIRLRLREAESSRWLAGETSGLQRRLIRRLQQLARAAAHARDEQRLTLLQRTVQAVSGGLTAGEAQQMPELLAMSDSVVLTQLFAHPFQPRERVSAVPRLCGLLRFNFPA